MNSELIPSPPRASHLAPARLFAPTPQAAKRTVEFFTVNISTDHTRKAYLNATKRFSEWCQAHGVDQLADVQPFQVAVFLKDLETDFSLPTVKQHLAALRMLFDWHVIGQIMSANPTHAVRGPKYVV